MKLILILSALIGYAWVSTHRDSHFMSSMLSHIETPQLKCITRDGKTFYGEVPKGIHCERMEPVNGALTIVPTSNTSKQEDSIMGGDSPSVPQKSGQCDGRTRCSQMTSCDEATYFLRNCPGVEMDGDKDGIPCESQWCN